MCADSKVRDERKGVGFGFVAETQHAFLLGTRDDKQMACGWIHGDTFRICVASVEAGHCRRQRLPKGAHIVEGVAKNTLPVIIGDIDMAIGGMPGNARGLGARRIGRRCQPGSVALGRVKGHLEDVESCEDAFPSGGIGLLAVLADLGVGEQQVTAASQVSHPRNVGATHWRLGPEIRVADKFQAICGGGCNPTPGVVTWVHVVGVGL